MPVKKGDYKGTKIDYKQKLVPSNRPLWSQYKPTDTMPGTVERMIVLEARVRARVPTSHPLDAEMSGELVTEQRKLQELKGAKRVAKSKGRKHKKKYHEEESE